MKRRNFLINALIGGAAMTSTKEVLASVKDSAAYAVKKPVVRIGICTDLHHDLIKDGEKRIQAFIDEMNILKPDFIIQIGDFCVPKEKNRPLMDIWNQFKGPKYHVIGNHDTDGGFTHDQVVDFWGAKGKYYSFDTNGYHFVVLNGNERPEGDTSKGYPRSITKQQVQWMKKDIESTSLPVIVFCHQGIDNDMDGIKEGALLRLVFENINKKASFKKIRLVLSGHNHEDYLNTYNNIPYLQINSMAYQFSHPEKGYAFAHTEDPLWAVLTINPNGTMDLKGTKSTYVSFDMNSNSPEYNGYPTVPWISDRHITL
ncbi:metallophosphoesterase family protein [Pedobacter frigoris]|uniref:metallophosphoesterase family protein n=1 Tax=Pedobacter frigoris TaxID=2571272 RepID=UPI00292D9816|nr:metallophosphoesterase [Pedobacter frigoris]